MASTITVPTSDQLGNFPHAIAQSLASVAAAAVVDINALQLPQTFGAYRCKGACTTAQTLATFDSVSGGTPRDGVTYAAGDVVLLANQVTKSQNGPWVVGTVASGIAPLTRPTWWATALVVAPSAEFRVNTGTLFANTTWKITTAGNITVDTTTFDIYPNDVTQSVTLTSGTVTVTNVPILSATKSNFLFKRITPTSTALTTDYCPTAAPTVGIAGTASLILIATVAAGTINAADGSVGNLTIKNW